MEYITENQGSPIIGIIIALYQSTTYFKVFNTNIHVQHVLYYKERLRSHSVDV